MGYISEKERQVENCTLHLNRRSTFTSPYVHFYITDISFGLRESCSQGRIQKIQKEGAESPTTPTPRPKENFTFQPTCSIQHCGRIHDESEATLMFRKKELKRTFYKTISRTVRRGGVVQKCFEKGGRGPIGPSPKSAYGSDVSYGHFVLPL